MIELLYITTKDKPQALSIGRALVERRLCACVNVFDGMTSIYRWQGVTCEDQEAVLIVKTTAAQREAVIAAVKELHSYEIPCVLALPVHGGHEPYLTWLVQQLPS